jgi:hypothetical protein
MHCRYPINKNNADYCNRLCGNTTVPFCSTHQYISMIEPQNRLDDSSQFINTLDSITENDTPPDSNRSVSLKITTDSCSNFCHNNSFFCYTHLKMFGLKTDCSYLVSLYKSVKKKIFGKHGVDTIKRCTYNETDFLCGICYEKYSQMNPVLFLDCCAYKQMACVECLSNVLIEHYLTKYYQTLVYNRYLFYLFTKTGFPCPFCRKCIFIKHLNVDTALFVYNIEKNVVRKLPSSSNYNHNFTHIPNFP